MALPAAGAAVAGAGSTSGGVSGVAGAGAGGVAGAGSGSGAGLGAQGAAGAGGKSAGGRLPKQVGRGLRRGASRRGDNQERSLLEQLALLALALFGFLLLLLLVILLPLLLLLAFFGGGGGGGQGGYPADSGIPQVYWPMYEVAAGHYNVNPYLLASIHKQESGFSANAGVRSGWNSCKAAGPMQMGVVGVPPYNAPAGGCSAGSTWRAYQDASQPFARPAAYPLDRRKLPSCRGVAGDTGCVYDDFDAIAAAAQKLMTGGAGRSLSSRGTTRAVYAYNHSSDYVKTVLDRARAWEMLGAAAIDLPVGDTQPRTLQRVRAVANAIDEQTARGQIPYCFGGGHGTKPGLSRSIFYCWEGNRKVFLSAREGLDCSGAVRWLLVQSGYPDPGGIASGAYGGYLKPAAGGKVLVHYQGGAPGHIWVEIEGRAWQTSMTNVNHGPGWTPMRSTAGFNTGQVDVG
jgi:hypothetical protein